MPRVSVVIPAYNAQSTIERALRSVFAQSVTAYELIVVDDHSSDRTLERVEAACHGRSAVKLMSLPDNRGAAAARNAGIAAATGDLVAFLDSDDEWLPEKLERQVAALDAAPDAVVAGCNAVWLDPAGEFSHKLEVGPVTTGAGAWKALLRSCYLSTPCVIARRRALEAENGFDETLPVGEDQDLWFRLAQRGEVLFLPEVLVRIHKQADSLMARQTMGVVIHYLPMVERHVARHRDRISDTDRRAILGPKYSKAGRYFYVLGETLLGLKLIGRTIRIGYRPIYHMLFIVAKAPLVRGLVDRVGTLYASEKSEPACLK